MSEVIGIVAGIGMACGPPLIYVDQAYSMYRSRDSSGFSHDVCGVILIANITRCFFFIGHPFELALIIQSLLLIISQLLLLALCLAYRPLPVHLTALTPSLSSSSTLSPLPPPPQLKATKSIFLGGSHRPFNFWKWEKLATYLEFLAGMIVILGILQVILGRKSWYVESLGFIALSIESTLPIPQFLSNFSRKTCHGFRSSTLAGWLGGDIFKTGYFFVKGSPLQFKVTALMTVCFDLAVLAQRVYYGSNPPSVQPIEAEEYEHVVGEDEDDETEQEQNSITKGHGRSQEV